MYGETKTACVRHPLLHMIPRVLLQYIHPFIHAARCQHGKFASCLFQVGTRPGC